MRFREWHLGAVAAVLLLGGMGCGQTYKINGKVTLDGQPVAGAQVRFIPRGDTGRSAVGFTGKDGTFTLTTVKQGDGALKGEYKVTVSKLSEHAIIPNKPNDKDAMKRIMSQVMQESRKLKKDQGKALDTLPLVYSDPEKSPLDQSVPDKSYDQDLRSAMAGPGVK